MLTHLGPGLLGQSSVSSPCLLQPFAFKLNTEQQDSSVWGEKDGGTASPASLIAATTVSVSTPQSDIWTGNGFTFSVFYLFPSLVFSLMEYLLSFSPSNFLFLGFCFNSMPKLASLPQAPLPSAPSSFLPLSPLGPSLGCCETPVLSLAEAQQELQMLQKQLGESEHLLLCWCACKRQPHDVVLCMALA